jgi:hypothetical protein
LGLLVGALDALTPGEATGIVNITDELLVLATLAAVMFGAMLALALVESALPGSALLGSVPVTLTLTPVVNGGVPASSWTLGFEARTEPVPELSLCCPTPLDASDSVQALIPPKVARDKQSRSAPVLGLDCWCRTAWNGICAFHINIRASLGAKHSFEQACFGKAR